MRMMEDCHRQEGIGKDKAIQGNADDSCSNGFFADVPSEECQIKWEFKRKFTVVYSSEDNLPMVNSLVISAGTGQQQPQQSILSSKPVCRDTQQCSQFCDKKSYSSLGESLSSLTGCTSFTRFPPNNFYHGIRTDQQLDCIGSPNEDVIGTTMPSSKDLPSQYFNRRKRSRKAFHCEVCGMYFISYLSQLKHSFGKLHKKRMKEVQSVTAESFIPGNAYHAKPVSPTDSKSGDCVQADKGTSAKMDVTFLKLGSLSTQGAAFPLRMLEDIQPLRGRQATLAEEAGNAVEVDGELEKTNAEGPEDFPELVSCQVVLSEMVSPSGNVKFFSRHTQEAACKLSCHGPTSDNQQKNNLWPATDHRTSHSMDCSPVIDLTISSDQPSYSLSDDDSVILTLSSDSDDSSVIICDPEQDHPFDGHVTSAGDSSRNLAKKRSSSLDTSDDKQMSGEIGRSSADYSVIESLDITIVDEIINLPDDACSSQTQSSVIKNADGAPSLSIADDAPLPNTTDERGGEQDLTGGSPCRPASTPPATSSRPLDAFSTRTLLDELKKRRFLFMCVCGMSFLEEEDLFDCHRMHHVSGNPMMCSFCQSQFSNWTDFNNHLLLHQCY